MKPKTSKKTSRSAPSASALGKRRVFFPFDDHALPIQHGVQLGLIPYSTAVDAGGPNVVIPLGPPGSPDSHAVLYYGTVLEVNGELWMWYLGRGKSPVKGRDYRVCFAKSRDGRNWEKPALGLVECEGGKQNNLIDLAGGKQAILCCVVFHEPEDPEPRKRFKMLYQSDLHKGRFSVAYSGDGVRWTESPKNPVGPFFEPAGGTRWGSAYHVNGQGHDARWPFSRRLITHISYDFENWTQGSCLGFRRDPLPPRPQTATGSSDGEQVHLGACLWNRGNVVLGLYGQWHGHPSNDRRWVTIDIGLIVSHDALHFVEPVPDFRIVGCQESVSWLPPDSFPFERAPALMQGQGMANVGDETLFWYSVWGVGRAGVKLARWERDRLGFLAPRAIEGWMDPNHSPHVVSMPVDVEGKRAAVSLNIGGLGRYSRVRVSILDEEFRPLPGYGAKECLGPKAGGLQQQVTWRGKEHVTAKGPIRVRVDFEGVRPEDIRLYAVYVD